MLLGMEARYLGPRDQITFYGEHAEVVSAYTYAGVYGETTVLEYRYAGATRTSTVRMSANAQIEV
jgi:hypothetical protein